MDVIISLQTKILHGAIILPANARSQIREPIYFKHSITLFKSLAAVEEPNLKVKT